MVWMLLIYRKEGDCTGEQLYVCCNEGQKNVGLVERLKWSIREITREGEKVCGGVSNDYSVK